MSDILILNDSPAVIAPKSHKKHNINSQNARELGEKGRAAKRSIIEKRIADAVAIAVQAVHNEYAAERAAALARLESHPKVRLLRIRTELDRLDKLLSETTEAKAYQALATALAKLTEVERVLDGRPLPGQLRPNTPRLSKNRTDAVTIAPVEE